MDARGTGWDITPGLLPGTGRWSLGPSSRPRPTSFPSLIAGVPGVYPIKADIREQHYENQLCDTDPAKFQTLQNILEAAQSGGHTGTDVTEKRPPLHASLPPGHL